MEGNYPPGFYTTEREQQENRHQAPRPPQQQQQQHVAHYPLELPIPYHMSQHHAEYVVDQPHRAYPAHHGAPMLRSIYQDSAPVLSSSSTIHQVHQQSPFSLRGHGVKSAIMTSSYSSPITTPEPVIESNILPVATHEQGLVNNTTQQQGEVDRALAPVQQTQCQKQIEQCPASSIPSQQASTNLPALNNPSLEPPLLAALNLKKNRTLSSGQELPRGLSFKMTSDGKVNGVVAKETIEKGVEFGPMTGTLMTEDEGWSKESTWEVCISGRVFFYIGSHQIWMSHLRCAQTEEEQNIEAYQYYGQIYHKSTKVIEPGSELKVFYSEEYKKSAGIQIDLKNLTFNQNAQKFQCNHCEGLFISAKVILRHIRSEHNSIKPDEMIPVLKWKKKKKKLEEEIEVSLDDHQVKKEKKSSNKEEDVFKCVTCDKVFSSCGRLKAHELFHEFKQDHACSVCGKKQINAQALAKHMMTHDSKLYKCKKCNRKFKSENAVNKHERVVHGYQCRFCSERFSKQNECVKHEQTHQAFKTSQSASKTSSKKTEVSESTPEEPKDMLGKTSNYYLKQRPYKCRFCQKRYISRCSAKDHEKEAHTKEGSYKCNHCPKGFTSERRLIEHLISHEQKGFYRCTLCPRSFGSESALNNHQGEHTGLKPFKCEICGRGFRVKNHFHAHKRRMHQERPLRFFCSVCNKGFADKGSIPSWLKGNLLRNGPGSFEIGEERVDHLFDGFSFLHRFIMEEGGKVRYQGRFLRSDYYEKSMKHQRLVFNGFGTPARHADPCKTLFQRVVSLFKPDFGDNCNVNWIKAGDEYYALTETPEIKKINVDSLDVLDTVNMEKLIGVHTATAHPHMGRDGTVYNLGTTMHMRSRYCVIKIPPTIKNTAEDPLSGASILATIPASYYNPSYYHSFGITENYMIFVEFPLHINLFKVLVAPLRNKPMTDCFDYYPDSKARFHLIRRDDGVVMSTTYTSDAFFSFHHVNAYETDDGNHIVVDMCCFHDESVLKRVHLDNIRSGNLVLHDCIVKRFVLPLGGDIKEDGSNLITMSRSKATAIGNEDGSIHCTPEDLCDVSLELPQINYAEYNGRDYTYMYGLGGDMKQLHKINVKTHEVVSWSEPGCLPSEPVFAPAPTKAAEDDGVILSCVADFSSDDRPPFLLVLDAQTFTEIARAIIPLPMSNFGFHGMFVETLS